MKVHVSTYEKYPEVSIWEDAEDEWGIEVSAEFFEKYQALRGEFYAMQAEILEKEKVVLRSVQ